jgi:hypothetical protein
MPAPASTAKPGRGLRGPVRGDHRRPGARTLGTGELVSQGKLPASALFAADSLPQAAGYTAYFGANNLIRSDYRAAYLADRAAHPCEPARPRR